MKLKKERRKRPRVPLQDSAFLLLGGQELKCRTLDIAASGLALQCSNRLELNSAVRVKFFLPNVAEWISTDAVVVRGEHRGGSSIWGLRFERLENFKVCHIETYVRESLTAQARSRHLRKPNGMKAAEKPVKKREQAEPKEKPRAGHDSLPSTKNVDLMELYRAAIKDLSK